MAGVYRPRHPERTVLYRVLSHHFPSFLSEYESRFEWEYGYFRSVVKEVIFTIPKMLRVFFKFKRRLLGDLSRAAGRFLGTAGVSGIGGQGRISLGPGKRGVGGDGLS